ncbi:hypothetical protein Q3G72_013529 [Acer saccharum]|nr:hypothetical protein Q3G72_013529 [Acer saccharum]
MVASSTFMIVAQNDSPRGTHLRCTGPYLMVIDNLLGFDTAVHEEAQQAINAAHVVAESIENGIGVVKLMGQYYGPGGHFEFIEKRLKEHGHMVIVIAEGAGKDLLTEGKSYHGPATPRRWFVDITKDKGTLCKKAKDGYKSETCLQTNSCGVHAHKSRSRLITWR